MQCSRCRKESVVFQEYSGLHLCDEHLLRDIGAKAKRTIRTRHWLEPRDHIAVALSGEAASSAVLAFLGDLVGKRRDIRLSALHAGIPGHAAQAASAEGVAGAMGVPFIRISLQERPLQEMDGPGDSGCMAPGTGNDTYGGAARILPALLRYAREQGITKIALGTVLEDRAEDVLNRILAGKILTLAGTGSSDDCSTPAIIHPFLSIPKKEAARYAAYWFPGRDFPVTEAYREPFAAEVKSLLDDYTGRHPSTRYSLVHLADRLGKVPVPGSCHSGESQAQPADDAGSQATREQGGHPW